MIAYINVFTRGIGYSHWEVDLGFTLLPKYKIKKRLTDTMNTWFTKNKNVYSLASYFGDEKESWIVNISFDC